MASRRGLFFFSRISYVSSGDSHMRESCRLQTSGTMAMVSHSGRGSLIGLSNQSATNAQCVFSGEIKCSMGCIMCCYKHGLHVRGNFPFIFSYKYTVIILGHAPIRMISSARLCQSSRGDLIEIIEGHGIKDSLSDPFGFESSNTGTPNSIEIFGINRG